MDGESTLMPNDWMDLSTYLFTYMPFTKSLNSCYESGMVLGPGATTVVHILF